MVGPHIYSWPWLHWHVWLSVGLALTGKWLLIGLPVRKSNTWALLIHIRIKKCVFAKRSIMFLSVSTFCWYWFVFLYHWTNLWYFIDINPMWWTCPCKIYYNATREGFLKEHNSDSGSVWCRWQVELLCDNYPLTWGSSDFTLNSFFGSNTEYIERTNQENDCDNAETSCR